VPPRIAYLADGKVHLKLADEPPRVAESPFAHPSVLARAATPGKHRARARTSWPPALRRGRGNDRGRRL